MDRKARREAREAKHFPYAHGVTHTRPILANGSHFNCANDAPEPDAVASEGCTHCDGTGEVYNHPSCIEPTSPCPNCGGSGTVVVLASSAALFGGDVEDGVRSDPVERGTRERRQ